MQKTETYNPFEVSSGATRSTYRIYFEIVSNKGLDSLELKNNMDKEELIFCWSITVTIGIRLEENFFFCAIKKNTIGIIICPDERMFRELFLQFMVVAE